MEEERSIRISRKRALRWYEKGGEFKELALQAYSEEELRPTVGEEVCAKMTEKYCRIFKFKVLNIKQNPILLYYYPHQYRWRQRRNCYLYNFLLYHYN